MKLFEHQEKALEETKGLNKVAYYLDMGLGKTFVGSEKMMQLGNWVNLVVCQKSKVDDWCEHLKTHYPKAKVIRLRTNKDLGDFNVAVWYTTTILDDEDCVPIIGVINYDLVWRRKDLLNLKDFTLMLDESSLIQNPKAKRTKFILKMKPASVILLSGTPTSGKYENLWSQIHLLGWNISQVTYNSHYVNFEEIKVAGVPIKVVSKKEPYKNVDRLKSKLREHGAVFMKTEECFDLPDQNFITVNCGSSKEYKKFKKDSIVEVDGLLLVGDTTLTKMMYSRMLCGQYNQDKLQAFKELVESTNDRLIVFYNFNEELFRLKQLVDKPISEVNGHTKDLTAYENESDSITFVQYQAGSMGLNLQKANKIIYFTLPLMSEHFEQSKKRIHRIGQEQPCFYYQLICKNSIEEKILQTLEMRKNFTDDLFKGMEL